MVASATIPNRRLPCLDGDAGVDGAGRVAQPGDSVLPTEADGELDHLKLVQRGERLGAASLDVERKRAAGAGALPDEDGA